MSDFDRAGSVISRIAFHIPAGGIKFRVSRACVARYLLSKFCYDKWLPFLSNPFPAGNRRRQIRLRDRKATLVPIFGLGAIFN